MPAIPVHTPLGFLGFALIVLGVFLFLAGLGILSVQKISVQPGRLTLATGVVSAIIGLALVLIFESGQKSGSAAIAAADQALAEASRWPVVFYDAFDGNQAGWELQSLDDENKVSLQTIEGGNLIWKLTSKNPDRWWWTTVLEKPYRDLSFSIRVRRAPGPEDVSASYGIVFRKQSDTAYRFLINDSGQYAVQAYDGARTPQARDLVAFTRSSVLKAGQFNELRVIAIGPKMTFFINGKYVTSVEDAAFGDGNVGFAVVPDDNALGREIEYAFDDLELRSSAGSS